MLVERQGCALRGIRLGDRARRAGRVIGLLAIGHDDIEPADRPAQQYDDDPPPLGSARGRRARAARSGRRPGAAAERDKRRAGGAEKEVATSHVHSYRRMKSGLPRMRAARNSTGDAARAARVRWPIAGPSRLSSGAASTGSAADSDTSIAGPGASAAARNGKRPEATAVAKLTPLT